MSDTLPPRPTFTNGQYIGADDLNAAVAYARDEAERLALSGRTWGIAAGLALIELTDATGAVQMFIEPGIACDGYGRHVVVISPAPVTADLFAGLNSGNQMVWLRYRAADTQMIAPGFQTCGAGDPATRIAESYAIETGSPTVTQRTAGVVINGVSVPDPRDMLIAVDQAAAVVLDGSAPHQIFPDDTAQWLIPIGIVAYNAGSPGSFTARTPAQLALSRQARRYVGTVAESVFAADGVLRLRDRQTDRETGLTDDQLDAKFAIQTTDIAVDPNNATRLIGNELVWVEGNMRVTGNARLFGHRLELRDQAGTEAGGAPEFLRRGTSANNTLGGQDLQICIGGTSGTAGADRLTIGIVGAASAGNPDGVLNELMVVRTDGKAALGTTAIDSYSALANTMVVAGPADSGITVASGASNTGNLYFAGGTARPDAGFIRYDQNANQMQFGTARSPRVFIDGAGNVGIGTTAPRSVLEVDASAPGALGPVLTLTNGAGGSNAAAAVDFNTFPPASGTYNPSSRIAAVDDGNWANDIVFSSNNPGAPDNGLTERCRITSQGNVGIGTSAPGFKLDVTDRIRLRQGPSGTAGLWLFQTAPNQDRAFIGMASDTQVGLWGNTGANWGLVMDTGTGNVGIGIGMAAPAATLDIGGPVHASSFPTSSDQRFKTNLAPITDALPKLDSIRGVIFDWNELYESLGRSTGRREIGVIAQDVEKVFPELVSTWHEEGYKAVDYGRLAAVLVEGVKELKARNEALERRVAALEESLNQRNGRAPRETAARRRRARAGPKPQ